MQDAACKNVNSKTLCQANRKNIYNTLCINYNHKSYKY